MTSCAMLAGTSCALVPPRKLDWTGVKKLNALVNFWLSYQLLFFVFTSIFPFISFQSSKDAITRALIVKCDGQPVQHVDVEV